MTVRRLATFAAAVALIGLLFLISGCGDSSDSTAATEPSPAADPAAARTLNIPGGGMPEGGGASGRLVWDLPEGWVEEAPASNMRLAQYRVPGIDGVGVCVVYYFGPGQGGDPMANATRWAGQFKQDDGSSSVDRMKVTRLEGAKVPATLVEVTGTYDGGMSMTAAPAEPQPGSMLLGGIVEGADAPWFFKFTGPEKTLRKQREAFVSMLTSIRSAG